MKDRIKEIRKNSPEKTLERFGEKIGISGAAVSQIESGKTNPTNQTIKAICSVYRVNENWLRTGEGKMYLPQEDEEAAYVSDLLLGSDNELYSIIKAIMKTYSELGEKEKKVLESFAKDLRDNLK